MRDLKPLRKEKLLKVPEKLRPSIGYLYDPNEEVRKATIRRLVNPENLNVIKDNREVVLPHIHNALLDENAHVRHDAALILGYAPHATSMKPLQNLLKTEEDADVVNRINWSLQEIMKGKKY